MSRVPTRLLALAAALLFTLGAVWVTWPSSSPRAPTGTARSASPRPGKVQKRPWGPAQAEPVAAEDPDEPQAAKVKDDLVASQIVVEAEQAFETADLETATELFQRIVDRYPDSSYAPYAAYKLAWCRFNGGDRVEAIRSMELLAGWLESSSVPGGDKLAREARKDLELFRTTDDELPGGGQGEEEEE